MPALRRPHSPGQAWRPELAVSSLTCPRQRPNDYECACLTLERGKTYNTHNAEVAQVVEQRTENPRVSSSTLLLGTSYAIMRRGQLAVECFFPDAKLVRELRLKSERAEVAER
jgi:hypothetical protein